MFPTWHIWRFLVNLLHTDLMKCDLVTRFEEASAEEITKVLNHLERSKQLPRRLYPAVEAKEEKPIAAAPLVEAKAPISAKDLNADVAFPEDVVFYMEARKSNLTVCSDELKLTFRSFGFMTQGLAGERHTLDSIQAVQFKETGNFTVGFFAVHDHGWR